MNKRIARRQQDQGFTLIELLVVIIIIGILAAIAIPVYLNQRKRGYDASAKSDVREMATYEETYLANYQTYTDMTAIQAENPNLHVSPKVTVTIVAYNGAQGYCLSAVHSASNVVWYYDSLGGGMQPKGASGCPVSTTGPAGGSLTGP